ncbi:MAG: Bax protein [Flavobacterium sp.]|jgi:Bax protein
MLIDWVVVNQYKEYLIIPTLIVIVILITFFHDYRVPPAVATKEPPSSVPEFRSYTDVKKKKSDFFAYMLPMIRQANKALMEERNFILNLDLGKKLSQQSLSKLQLMSKKYKIKQTESTMQNPITNELIDSELVNKLLSRVDKVPASLILAQSANESAWGTSRFAREANNFFGIWCFSKGCGIKPLSRDEGLIHEVAKFKEVQDGVDYYTRMINTHSAYKALRRIRENQRQEGQTLSGSRLAEGLIKYSERGDAYVQEIKAMIRTNKLAKYNI